ncbi:MAG: response regulator [Planctomycetes bacterium]|nr:response regulator [Planctomycetota bacterium]
MSETLRIAVADDEPDMRDYFKKILPRLGFRVVAVAENGCELVELCRKTNPDLAITDIKMPELDGIDAAMQIYQDKPIPVILVSAYSDAELIKRAEADHVMGYLVKPIKQSDLVPAIALAMHRFEQFQALRQEAADMRKALADRKVIEQAKGILMKKGGLDEQEAFRRLQKLASEQNRKLVDIATMLMTAEETIQTFIPHGKV